MVILVMAVLSRTENLLPSEQLRCKGQVSVEKDTNKVVGTFSSNVNKFRRDYSRQNHKRGKISFLEEVNPYLWILTWFLPNFSLIF